MGFLRLPLLYYRHVLGTKFSTLLHTLASILLTVKMPFNARFSACETNQQHSQF